MNLVHEKNEPIFFYDKARFSVGVFVDKMYLY